MSSPEEADERRARMRSNWEGASAGWGRQADSVRDSGMPVSAWMIEHADLQPGQRVLELAAGPGDTGFLAAEVVAPGGGVVLCSDGAEGMLAVARERAAELGVGNVEFRQLELEWIDLPTADVDVVLCRWGLMLCLDPAAALAECRRVLRPGGRMVAAVWDRPEANLAMTAPGAAAVALGLAAPPEPGAPGPFALADVGRLRGLFEDAGFLEIVVEPVAIERRYPNVQGLIGESLDLSMAFGTVWRGLADGDRRRLVAEVAARLEPFAEGEGGLVIPGRSLGIAAEA